MSRQGWRDFLAADGVEDWVVFRAGNRVCIASWPDGAEPSSRE
jgi:hypothetical protein